MPKHDDPSPPSLCELEEAAMLMPDGPEKVSCLKRLQELRRLAANLVVLREEIRIQGGGEGLDPPPFSKDYPDA